MWRLSRAFELGEGPEWVVSGLPSYLFVQLDFYCILLVADRVFAP